MSKLRRFVASYTGKRTLQTFDNPFGTGLSPVSEARDVTYVSGMDTEKMVAGDTCGHLSRIDVPGIIDLGTWQVELVKAIGKYLQYNNKSTAADS